MSEREKLIEVMARGIMRESLKGIASEAMIESILNGHFARWRGDKDDPHSLVHSSVPAVSMRRAEAALTALEAAGVRLVPVEATGEMIQMAESLHTVDELTTDEYRRAYKAMIAFSPYAPEET